MTSDTPAVVLLVDDDEAKRYVLATWLRRAGHTVIEAGTGQEALDRISSAELVLLDVNLPDISGIEVCQRIKTEPLTMAIPVIQVSATAVAVADRAHGLNQGADAYLIDPTEPEELLATVAAALRYYRARQRAELTATRLTTLTTVTMNINAARTFSRLARSATAGAAQVFGASAVLITVLPNGQLCRMSASPDDLEPVQWAGPTTLAESVAEHVLGAGEGSAAMMLPRADWLRLVADTPLSGDVCVAVARTNTSRPPVAVAISPNEVCGDEEVQILRQLVQFIALAVEALRSYAEEHLVALTLQRSLLPSTLPEMPGLALAVRYLPASDQAEVGGDFFEAMTWHDRMLVAIGDVEGHSLHAATVMGELRHALRAFASEGHSPLAIASLLNSALQRYYPNVIATLCLALFSPVTGDVEMVNCGHIPALIIEGTKACYRGEGGLMLGLPVHEPHVEHLFLPENGTAVLITDGLVEDRRVPLDVNMERLRVAAEDAGGADLEGFSDHLMALFGPREDDVAMIALRRIQRSGPPSS